MLRRVTAGATDLARAMAFCDAVFAPLGIVCFGTDIAGGRAGWQARGECCPTFRICHPHDGNAPHPGNGRMTGLCAPDTRAVRDAHAAALAAGGSDAGAPGRRDDASGRYGGHVRDPGGDKPCFVDRVEAGGAHT